MLYKRKIPIFCCSIYVYVGPEELDNYIGSVYKSFGMDIRKEISSGTAGYTVGSVIWIRRPDLGILSHELGHCIDEIAKAKGITDTSREFQAYLTGWALPWFWDRIK